MKKLLKAGFIALMMVGSLASCTDGVSGTTVATPTTPTQPKEDGKMTVEEARAYADAHYSQDKVAEKYNQGEAVINYDLKKCEGLLLTQLGQLGIKVGADSTTQTLKEEDLVVLTSKDIDSMTKAIDSYEGKDKAKLNFSMTENIMKIEFDFPASVLTAALEALFTGIQNSDGTPGIRYEDFVGSGAGMSGYITVNELGLTSGVDATIDYTLTFNYVYESTLPNGTTNTKLSDTENKKLSDTESILGDATATITYSMGETTKEA